MNREEWLITLVDKLFPVFEEQGCILPPVHISVGFPSRKAIANKSRVIGECWAGECSSDGVPHIFVSPVLVDVITVAGVVVHELIHAAVGPSCGHTGAFRKLGVAIGLVGKMAHSEVGPVLRERLNPILNSMPPYPHAQLTFDPNRKKQSTRLLKLECPSDGYTVRVTRKWIELGLPSCPCGDLLEVD